MYHGLFILLILTTCVFSDIVDYIVNSQDSRGKDVFAIIYVSSLHLVEPVFRSYLLVYNYLLLK